jgi:hypothetical protein
MLEVFTPLTPEAQRESRAAYRSFLIARDGTPDLATRTLSLREQSMDRFHRKLSRQREVDRELFMKQYVRFDRKQPMSREALLLLALVTLNSAESYGVTQTFDMVHTRAMEAVDDVEFLLLIEEVYHTRILLSAAPLWGLDIAAPARPPLFLRGLITAIVRGPGVVSQPLVLASEVVATIMCVKLLQATGEILKHDPELRDTIEERITEVLVDEIGHVSFNRTLVGPRALAAAQFFWPKVARHTEMMMPVLGALGVNLSCDDVNTLTSSKRLPASVRQTAYVA